MKKSSIKKLISIALGIAMLISLYVPAMAAESFSVGENHVLKSTTAGGSIRSMAVYRNYLYIAVNNVGIKIFNITNPSAPSEVQIADNIKTDLTFSIPSDVYGDGGVMIDGDYLYCSVGASNSEKEIRKFSLEVPEAPVLVQKFTDTNAGKGRGQMAVWGDYLFTTEHTSRTAVYNMTKTPNAETGEIGVDRRFNNGGAKFEIFGDIYVSAYEEKVYAVDLTTGLTGLNQNIENETEATVIATVSDKKLHGYNYKVEKDGDYFYFTDRKDIYRINMSGGIAKKEVETVYTATSNINNYEVDDGILYVHEDTAKEITYKKLGTEDEWAIISTVGQTNESCQKFEKYDDLLIFSDGYDLNIIPTYDLELTLSLKGEDTVSFTKGTSESTGSYQRHASATKDDYLYVAYRNKDYTNNIERGGVDVYDISNPAAPIKLDTASNTFLHSDSKCVTADTWSPMAVIGDYLYCAFGTAGNLEIRKFSLANPAAPAYIATYKDEKYVSNFVNSFAADENYFYAVGWNGDCIAKFDNSYTTTNSAEHVITDACKEVTINACNLKLMLLGDILYGYHINNNDKRVYAYNSETLAQIMNTGSVKYLGMEIDADKEVGYLLTDNSLVSVDLSEGCSNIEDTVWMSTLAVSDLGTVQKNMVLSGDYLYVSETGTENIETTLYVFDVSNPYNMELVSDSITVKSSNIAADSDGNAYVTYKPGSGSALTPVTITVTEGGESAGTAFNNIPVTFMGSAKGADTVSLTINGGTARSVQVIGGKWSYIAEELAAGEHIVEVTLTSGGGTLTETKTFTYLTGVNAKVIYGDSEGNITAATTIENNYSDREYKVVVITAGYDGSKLAVCDLATDAIKPGMSKTINTAITDGEYTEVKTFVLTNNLVPICEEATR